MNIHEIEIDLANFDKLLRPIVKEPVDISDVDWSKKLLEKPHPLDRAHIRKAVESLLTDIVDYYAVCSTEKRRILRDLFERYDSFACAATPPWPTNSPDGRRRHLLLFSIRDQGKDTRDAIVELDYLLNFFYSEKTEFNAVIEEIADLSSKTNKYGMGSTRDLLLNKLKK